MIVVLEVRARYPLLVVESDEDLDWIALRECQCLFGDFLAAPEPGQRWHDALEALLLSVPVGCDLSLASLCAKLDSLDGRIVDSFAEDVYTGTAI